MNRTSPRAIRRSIIFVLGSKNNVYQYSVATTVQRLHCIKGRRRAGRSNKLDERKNRDPAVAQGTFANKPSRKKAARSSRHHQTPKSRRQGRIRCSNALDGNRPLALKLLLVALLVLLLAVLEACAVMRFQHAVLAAEVARAEAAVADDALRGIAAVLEAAANLFWCTAADWKSEVDCGLAGDGVRCEGRRRLGQVLARVDEAQRRGW